MRQPGRTGTAGGDRRRAPGARGAERRRPVAVRPAVERRARAGDPTPAAVWETGRERRPLRDAADGLDAGEDRDREAASTRRAQAHAAFRTVEGGEQPALDAALGVVEAEVARLRQAVLVYGEALKAIQVYGPDEETRVAAKAALRRAPERLRAAAPVPQLDRGSAGGADG